MKEILRCLLLPLSHKTLIVPYAAVAEVTAFVEPQPLSNTPSWVLGMFDWHERKIPLIALENFESSEAKNQRTYLHIAVFNRIADTTVDFFGLQLSQIPRMHRINPKDLTAPKKSTLPYLLSDLRFREEEVAIPNIEWIEQSLAKITS